MNDLELMEEIFEWRDVPEYEGLYKVSEYGDVMSLNYNRTGEKRLLKQSKDRYGYMFVKLCKNGIQKAYKVHRLVATSFCEGADYFQEVNHMDEDKTNNHYTNLEWCTNDYNINYGSRNKKSSESHKKKVRCVELDMIFDSVTEASRYVNISRPNLSNCLCGRCNLCAGFHWEYIY